MPPIVPESDPPQSRTVRAASEEGDVFPDASVDLVSCVSLTGVTTPTGRRRPDAIGLHPGRPADPATCVDGAGGPA